ncbi:protein of unknown function [Pseudooceanicola antarcticus]|uniref:DUF4062 domain-containing protein n=1 Tax=Pseudooceanicola antarcticus TaxID=1247613 RepID=A0A285JD66_9RHOB|nr:DUF4062 domain-containing protein [Pseudooceanicola antarcticus]PJE31345.1 DUF4062 domain-containing protein [Pseudooceanicola antarcticus]SNY58202.1 protein of unknown function [Pseudooceanicola antarcticus]
MHDKRYSVFISSTFEDLKDERRAVQDTVISAGDFPVQMEYFPATDEAAFDLIKSLLDKCDYYLLIIGGRYGSLDADGLSFTHKEFRYALSRNIPVMVMLNGARGKIPVERTEATDAGKQRLEEFIAEASNGRTRKTWSTIGELQAAVLAALIHAKQTKPATGWMRGDAVASADALEELTEVLKENAKYRDAIGHLEVELALPPLPAGDDHVEIDLMPVSVQGGYGGGTSGTYARLGCTWVGAFPVFYSNLKWRTSDWDGETNYYIEEDESCDAIGAAFAGELASFDTEHLFRINKATFDRLCSYYIEVGLMVSQGEHPFTEPAQRFARRHRINGGKGVVPIILEGSIERKVTAPAKSTLDDEIPF